MPLLLLLLDELGSEEEAEVVALGPELEQISLEQVRACRA